MLYRIIGNDLVPRHSKGQSRANLSFILKNEADFPGCEKRFVVNRIVDSEEERAIIALLESSGKPFIHIPFVWDEYRSIPWDNSFEFEKYKPGSRLFSRLSEGEQGRVIMRLYRHKNNYVMNNNGARNAALREGRQLAKWVLPWDGNCSLTPDAWRQLREAVTTSPEIPYFLVPMARVTDNRQLLNDSFTPKAGEEPQILFRRDAPLEFNCAFPYGRRPKVELFWRLGVPGKWDRWPIEPWDLPCPPYAEQAGAFAHAGWVARLFSGQAHLEKKGSQRALVRVEAIRGFLEALDGTEFADDGK
ncbi:hypothetical protein ACHHRT_11120 [Desulfurivibrio sp. D14AmB]|uniref:hypothetical protein n=1 Tax=Desulfurivibrio sp. D14AmB TaxID=3374370 RepID=UPI00376F164D